MYVVRISQHAWVNSRFHIDCGYYVEHLNVTTFAKLLNQSWFLRGELKLHNRKTEWIWWIEVAHLCPVNLGCAVGCMGTEGHTKFTVEISFCSTEHDLREAYDPREAQLSTVWKNQLVFWVIDVTGMNHMFSCLTEWNKQHKTTSRALWWIIVSLKLWD